jgi:hypothetical protein
MPGAHMTYERRSMYSYRISGLHVSSQFELPGAIPEAARTELADVTIRRRTVPATLEGAGPAALEGADTGLTWQMAGEKFLLQVPRLARFLIAHGREIDVELEPDVKQRDAIGFVLGTSFGVLLHQRGALVLHGAAVASGGRAIVICGESGAGKSTLAAALCREGCSFVADDICVISLSGQREPIVQSDGRQLKLWQESIVNLDLRTRRGDAVLDKFEKYYVRPFDIIAEPAKLSAIYVLRSARPRPRKQAGILSVALPDAIRMLEYEAYRPGLCAKIKSKPTMLAQAAAVFGHAEVFLLIRPVGFEHLKDTVASVLEHWDTLDR